MDKNEEKWPKITQVLFSKIRPKSAKFTVKTDSPMGKGMIPSGGESRDEEMVKNESKNS